MSIRGIVIPAGEGTEGLHDIKVYEVEAEGYLGLFRKCGIEYGERVSNTELSVNFDFAAWVDGDGHKKFLRFNRVAQAVSGYYGPLVGNVLFTSMEMRDDGLSVVSLSPQAKDYIMRVLGLEPTKLLPELTEPLESPVEPMNQRTTERPNMRFFRF